MKKNYSEEETNYENEEEIDYENEEEIDCENEEEIDYESEEETDDSGFGLSFLRIPLISLVALFIVMGQGELEEGQFASACIWFSIAAALIALIIFMTVLLRRKYLNDSSANEDSSIDTSTTVICKHCGATYESKRKRKCTYCGASLKR